MSDQERIVEECPSCAQRIDVTDSDPFTLASCPSCSESFRIRANFDQFVIQDMLGEGGMSQVFRAWDSTLEREVAIKILNRDYSADSERIAQFEREAQLTASISHPNVVRAYSVGKDQGRFYIAMELVGGGSLDEQIASQGRLRASIISELALQCSEGLAAAHEVGLIHRDIKPGNILFSQDGTAKIVDFGLALIADRESDDSGEVWATPYYVAPESLDGREEDFRSDIYSLGATLFHAVTGSPSHAADTPNIKDLRRIKAQTVKLASRDPGLPASMCKVVDRMMASDPARRHRSYEQLVSDWRTCADELTGGAVAGAAAPALVKKKSPLPLILGGFVALILLVGGIFLFTRDKGGGTTGGGDTPIGGLPTTGGSSNIAGDFLGARTKLLGGEPGTAAEEFNAVANQTGVPTETQCWSRMNAALGFFLDGNPRNANTQLNKAAQEAASGSEDLSPGDVSFFRNLAEEMKAPAAPGADLLSYEDSGPQGIAPLVQGLGAWNQGSYEEALRLFSRFQTHTGGESAQWISQYHALVEPYKHDANLISEIGTFSRDLDATGISNLLEKATKVRNELKTRGRLPIAMDRLLETLRSRHTALTEEAGATNVARIESIREEEFEEFVSLVEALSNYHIGYEFPEAIASLGGSPFESPEIASAVEDQAYLWNGAEGFIEQLVEDLNEEGYTGALPNSSSETPLKGTVVDATRREIVFELESGEVSVQVEDIEPARLLSLGRFFIEKERNSSEYYRRWELMVTFANRCQLDQISTALSSALMQENRAFRERWLRIMEAQIGGG